MTRSVEPRILCFNMGPKMIRHFTARFLLWLERFLLRGYVQAAFEKLPGARTR